MIDPPGADTPAARAMDWFGVAVLAGTGLLVSFADRLDLQHDAAYVIPSFGWLVAAWLYFNVRRMSRRLRAIDELMADVRFGPGTKRDRDAVDILVQALRVSDEGARTTALRTLRKISGIDLGDDVAAWEEWWSVARATFVRPGPQPSPDRALRAGPKK